MAAREAPIGGESGARTMHKPLKTEIVIPKGALVIFDGLNKELYVGIHLVVIRIIHLGRKSGCLVHLGRKYGWLVHLGRKSGWLFCAFYFKQAASSLMMAYGGDEFVHPDNAVSVSLTRFGYPQIISSHHRHMILKKDEKADMLHVLIFSRASMEAAVRTAMEGGWRENFACDHGL
ncbi:unnamed protein product [Sphenostylis stenocarpa]|uniref:Uncharacterized protein n=1 Tax=Sphenostylis stenocarpa TaxID=92480 RepID=A0AA86SK53_9FABA|nr:unnamed protein product [Sphenostylis stenocarpa]